ncbi:chorismate mutase [Candidatus Termititenax persephonae]|uniref:chorismate mutase n=1 Tax=Candidatus Termititenax persephonae TaxID=2218525 RepID=A0A388TIW0_9BACT|nr:chorismate mutase [Candidatus Termititenax persephonae]
MTCRAVRGAITVEENSAEAVESATRELLLSVVQANRIKIKDIVQVIFSVTVDLNAQFPAVAARKLGWQYVPMLCTYELDVLGSLRKCIRLLLTCHTRTPQNKIKHCYLGGAVVLRPDLVK